MNTCYQREGQVGAHHNSYEYMSAVYPTQTMTNLDRIRSAASSVFGILAKCFLLLISLFAKTSGKRVLRVTVIAGCFFAFLGVIGGVEMGILSLGVGIILSAFLLFFEILCLR